MPPPYGYRPPMRLTRKVRDPIRAAVTWDERWLGPDSGLIYCWERGREIGTSRPDLSSRAGAGELIVLPWKGGVDPDRLPKTGSKFGTYRYLAMWQGLRAEDLEIDTDTETTVVCSRTRVVVTFTMDLATPRDSDSDEASLS